MNDDKQPEEKQEPQIQEYRLVVVDDNESVCNSIRRELGMKTKHESFRFQIKDFQDPEVAFNYICDHDVHLVISDIKMPFMTGDQLLAKIKERCPQKPVLIITGYATKDNILSIFKADKNTIILSKPWDPDRLYASIKKLLDLKDS